jgi:hypothetical protein
MLIAFNRRDGEVADTGSWAILRFSRFCAIALKSGQRRNNAGRDYELAYCLAATAKDELNQAGAFRVYADPAEMLESLEDLGLQN